MKNLAIAAVGACYVDFNATKFPFSETGIAADSEVVGREYIPVAGGSAVNFCRLLGSVGLDTAFIGLAGRDTMGEMLVRLLEDSGVQPYISRQDDLQTNISFNMTNPEGSHIMCVAGTANAALALPEIREQIEQAAAKARILYLGGCFKLKGLQPDFEEVVAIARRSDAALAVDHGRIPENVSTEMLASVRQLVCTSDYYFPSRDEFCALWEVDSIDSGLILLAGRAPGVKVIVKDGANGAFYLEGGSVRHVPALQLKEVVDVTGAGDAFNAGCMRAILDGRQLDEAVTYGCRVAGARISRADIPGLD